MLQTGFRDGGWVLLTDRGSHDTHVKSGSACSPRDLTALITCGWKVPSLWSVALCPHSWAFRRTFSQSCNIEASTPTSRTHCKLIKPPFSGHPEEPRTFHCVMLWPLLLSLLWAGSLAKNGDYELSVTNSVTVQEGLCTFVSCQVRYPTSSSSVFGYWYQEQTTTSLNYLVATNDPNRSVQKEAQGRFHLMGGPNTHNCSLEIRDAKRRDTGVYLFRVEGDGAMKYSFVKQKLSVDVIALSETPNFQVLPILVSGTSTQLICSLPWACERGTPPIFSWMSSALTSLGPRTILSSELNLTPKPQDHGTNITCQVTFPGVGVTMERTEQLSVTYAPQKVTIRASWGNDTEPQVLHNGSSLHIQEGKSLRLVCEADSNPPAVLSWEHLTQKPLQLSTEELQLQRVELEHQGEYTCGAQNSLGAQVASVRLSVKSLLQLLTPSCSWEAENLHCSCSSRAWPAPVLRWRLGEGLLEGNSSNVSFTVTSSSTGPWVNSSLSLSLEFSAGLRLSCEAWNDNGVQSATILLLPDKPETSTGVVQGAMRGAGIMALFAACICLIFFIVKVLRKKSALKVVSLTGNHPAVCPVSTIHGSSMISSSVSGHLNAPGSQSQKEQSPLAAVPHALEDEPELHYASLSFQGLKPRQPQNAETIKSDYTEIKIHKC
ncbi:sialic acid-binding Ig-like lectin 5 isoform X2 [Mesocricetus auratus]|uniref:Sialic acid-binding Ig-like lectin 5 isoform X2 n=1 Tax=Mesocricetus auratus TaxID=10036 RepID=A0A3Q0DAJ0_MESAU|nr:sialic acid-binding Ig-like lectin 5 isoform X2 [Mesocricetus auratus]